MLGINISLEGLSEHLWLPIGISFFTFQVQSYLLDVYYRVIPIERSWVRLSLFVMFFPQLVAGPIVKARHFLPQLKEQSKISQRDIEVGLLLITSGLLLKIVVADNLAHYTIALQSPMQEIRHSLNLLVLSWAFMVQVFGDFSGYTSIAIGLARLLGYRLPKNFNDPFLATGFNDFWSRWHMSLTNWFKDYVFLRLASRSVLQGRLQVCLMLTFLVSGLWHGPYWTYVLWGGLHGLGCVIDGKIHRKNGPRWKPKGLRAFCYRIFTFQMVCFLGIFFYHKTFSDVFKYFRALFIGGWSQPLMMPRLADMLFFMLPVVVMHTYAYFRKEMDLEKTKASPYLIGLNLVLLSSLWSDSQAFIYFAF
jgi:D-alanyl-lipoteichoic acid acyltransferase DltB (MBOAT superfamily)